MVITYEGLEYVRIQFGDLVLAFNPPSKNSKFKVSNSGADIVFISSQDDDFNGVETVTRKDRVPFVVSGPGEYEVQGLFIRGFLSKTNYGGVEKINTIYSLSVDDIKILFLGAMSGSDLDPEVKEKIGDTDILFVPIGGEGVLETADAYKLAVKREPKIIIPIHWSDVGEKDSLKKFLKEAGEEVKPIDKLTIKRKDIEGKEGDIVIIQPTA